MIDIKIQKALILTVLIAKYLESEPSGGSCHIILEDGNYDKKSINFCYNRSIDNNDYFGETISELLMIFDESEIEQIVERPWEIKIK